MSDPRAGAGVGLPSLHPLPCFSFRFLRSHALKTRYKDLYRPSTGAVMLLAALHTCDQVTPVTPVYSPSSDPSHTQRTAPLPAGRLGQNQFYCLCLLPPGERVRLHYAGLHELLRPLLRPGLQTRGLLHQPRPAPGDGSVAESAPRRPHPALHEQLRPAPAGGPGPSGVFGFKLGWSASRLWVQQPGPEARVAADPQNTSREKPVNFRIFFNRRF